MRPSVFIGSSSTPQASAIAWAAEAHLRTATTVYRWQSDEPHPNRSVLDFLVEATEQYDFAVMVFASDDETTRGSATFAVTRDNVVFELGLFMGSLGLGRAFILTEEEGGSLRLPTDIAGVYTYRYQRGGDVLQALSNPCGQILRQITSHPGFGGSPRNHGGDGTVDRVDRLTRLLYRHDFPPDLIIGISRGGLPAAGVLSKRVGGATRVPVMALSGYPGDREFDNDFNRIAVTRPTFRAMTGPIKILIVDDYCDTGAKLLAAQNHVRHSIDFEAKVETAALSLYRRTYGRVHNPTFFVDEMDQPGERYDGDLEQMAPDLPD